MIEIKFRARWKADLEIVEDINDRPISDLNADHLIIEQFTGFKDKNGVEIYEGDIVKTKFLWCEVKFRDGGFYPLNCGLSISELMIKVIGNSSENPELLEEFK